VSGNYDDFSESISFQSMSFPSNYIHVNNQAVGVSAIETENDKKDSSFFVRDMGEEGIQI
jgi:hypothetical protein